MSQSWTDFLACQGATLADYAVAFPTSEAPAEPDSFIVPLSHLSLLTSHGEDSAGFLHNLLSNDVQHLGDDGAQWTSFNTPKGRMLASLLLYRDLAGHGLILSADIAPAILKRLSMYVLRSKVKLSCPDAVLIGVGGPDAAAALERASLPVADAAMRQGVAPEARCIRLTGELFVIVSDAEEAPSVWTRLQEAGALPSGTDRWQLAMVRAGLPLVTAATQEEFVAQMLNYELIGGVNFKKGCYPGQEIVARTQYLGKLKKRMYRVHIPAGHEPAAGDDVYTPEFGEQSAGKLVTVAPAPQGGFEALAVMQTGCAAAGDARLAGADGPHLEFLPLPYTLE